MHRTPLATLLASALALILLPVLPTAPLAAQQDDAEWMRSCERQAERSDRAGFCEVRPGTVPLLAGALTVDGGRNGGVSVRGTAAGTAAGVARVSARVQAQARTDARAREIAGDVRVYVVDGRISADGPSTGTGESWSVSYQIDVPHRADLDLMARNGPVRVSDVSGRIRAETRNGPLGLHHLAGDVRARTRNGPVTVTLDGARWEGVGMDAETANGPVRLAVPEGYSAELETGTINGPLDLGFPLTVTLSGRSRSRLAATLGDGGPAVRVVTTNGPARLSRP